MRKLRIVAVTALAAGTLAGGLAAAPSASAAPRMSCATAIQLANAYMTTGQLLLAHGNTSDASYYFGRARGVLDAAC